jgi:hypothetical protein
MSVSPNAKNPHHVRYINLILNTIFVVLLTIPELSVKKLKSVIRVSGTIYPPQSLKLMLFSL